jgi:hypothetical protein
MFGLKFSMHFAYVPNSSIFLTSRGFATHGLGHFQRLHPHAWYQSEFLFNLQGFTAKALHHGACFVGTWPPAVVAPGALPHCYLSSVLVATPGCPYVSTILVATLVQELSKVIVGTYFCAKIAFDHINATMTYML